MSLSRFDHGGNIYAKREQGASPWLDFSANINPLGLSDAVRRAIIENVGGVVHYPDPAVRELKAALAEHYRVPMEAIILGNGAAELIYLFFAVVRPGKVLVPAPTFSEYERAARAAGADVEYFMLNATQNFIPDVREFTAAAEKANAAAVCFANPNNPTGGLVTTQWMQKWAAWHKASGKWAMADESFLDFLPNNESYSLLQRAATQERLLVIRSLTKFFALPGLRLGFAVAEPSFVKKLSLAKDVWNVNFLAQKAGVAALSDKIYQEKSRRFMATEKNFLADALGKIPGWKIFPPAVNFILADVTNTGKSAAGWASELREKGILIRTFNNYPGLTENYLRLAVRSRTENELLINAIKKQ